MNKIIIGIDTGMSGGIAVKDKNVKVYPMTNDVNKFCDFLRIIQETAVEQELIVFVEKVQLRHDDTAGKQFRIQKMLSNYSMIINTLKILKIPFCEVHPATWQKTLHIRLLGQKEEYSDRKRRFKEIAANLFPKTKVTLKNCDALLILLFGKIKLETDCDWVKENTYRYEKDLF